MPRQIDPQTLAAIGGQKQSAAAGQFQQSMSNLYSVTADMKERQLQRESHDKQMEVMDLKIEAQKQKAIGSAAVGVREMLDRTDNPANFIEQYRAYRSNAPDGVREHMPEAFNSMDEALMWSSQQMAQSEKLIPYLEVQKKASTTKQWEFLSSLLIKDPSSRSPSEQRILDFYEKKDQNIFVTQPSKTQREETIFNLQTVKYPGTDESVIDILDSKSGAAFIAGVNALAQSKIDMARQNKVVLPRNEAVMQAAQELMPFIQKKDGLIRSVPFIGDDIAKTIFDETQGYNYVFVPNEATTRQIYGLGEAKDTTPTPKQDTGPKIAVHGGYKWDMNTTPPTNLGPVE